jgi:hypothetical protein
LTAGDRINIFCTLVPTRSVHMNWCPAHRPFNMLPSKANRSRNGGPVVSNLPLSIARVMYLWILNRLTSWSFLSLLLPYSFISSIIWNITAELTVRRRPDHHPCCILYITYIKFTWTHSHMSRPLHNLVCCWRKEDIKSCLLRCMHGGTNSDIHFGVSHWSLHNERCKVLQDSQPPPLKPDMNSSPSENLDSGWVLTWVEVCR